MDGNKWKYFCMMCRFIGWYILACFTFGIGFLWLIPYVHMSHAKFYDDILKNQNPLETNESMTESGEII